MILSKLMQKGDLAQLATATPATPATYAKTYTLSVAGVATVAVALVPEPTYPMTAEQDAAIRAWLEHIDESDAEVVADVLNRCCTDLTARLYVLQCAEEMPPPPALTNRVICSDCRYFDRIDHPHLGHCARGEIEAIAGLWDTDHRWCDSYEQTVF